VVRLVAVESCLFELNFQIKNSKKNIETYKKSTECLHDASLEFTGMKTKEDQRQVNLKGEGTLSRSRLGLTTSLEAC